MSKPNDRIKYPNPLEIKLKKNPLCYISDRKKAAIAYSFYFHDPYSGADILKLTFYSFILASGTIGNGLVVKYFLRAPNQPGSRFVIGLAIIDFAASILLPLGNMPILLYGRGHWPFGKIACLITRLLNLPTFYASAWMLVAICLERAR